MMAGNEMGIPRSGLACCGHRGFGHSRVVNGRRLTRERRHKIIRVNRERFPQAVSGQEVKEGLNSTMGEE